MIIWDINPDIIKLGPFTIRWYGVLFALAFLLGLKIMQYIFKTENKKEKDLNDLFWYMILSTVIGARLGHVLFYAPGYYLSHPFEILKTWEGGLASHGAAIGILIGLFLFIKKHKYFTYLWVLDRVVITVALAAVFIRTGNLINSEIIGKPTGSDWGFVFASVDNIPRHPAQLYEAIAYSFCFGILSFLYLKYKGKLREGLLFSIFLIIVFGFRIIVEYFKENQSLFEAGLPLNMGQILSIPLVIAGIYLFFRNKKEAA